MPSFACPGTGPGTGPRRETDEASAGLQAGNVDAIPPALESPAAELQGSICLVSDSIQGGL